MRADCARCKQPFAPTEPSQRRCERCIEYYKAYYAANKESELARHAEWAAKNLQHLRAYTTRRRKQLGPKQLTPEQKVQRAVRQHGRYHSGKGYFYHAKWKYGMTQERYDALAAAQNHVCAICHLPPKGRFHIDHCHKSSEVRGLLCNSCNHGLGRFADDPQRLLRAIEYLKRSSHAAHPEGMHLQ